MRTRSFYSRCGMHAGRYLTLGGRDLQTRQGSIESGAGAVSAWLIRAASGTEWRAGVEPQSADAQRASSAVVHGSMPRSLNLPGPEGAAHDPKRHLSYTASYK
jgi:hypothetical protein